MYIELRKCAKSSDKLTSHINVGTWKEANLGFIVVACKKKGKRKHYTNPTRAIPKMNFRSDSYCELI